MFNLTSKYLSSIKRIKYKKKISMRIKVCSMKFLWLKVHILSIKIFKNKIKSNKKVGINKLKMECINKKKKKKILFNWQITFIVEIIL